MALKFNPLTGQFDIDTSVSITTLDTHYVALTPSTDSRNVIQPTLSTVKSLILRNAAAQSVNIFESQNDSGTAYVSIGPSTLAANGSQAFLNIVGTLTNPSGVVNTQGVNFNITSAGSTNANAISALRVTLGAGYTGGNTTNAMVFDNQVAGTGATWFADASAFGHRISGNRGVGGFARGNTTGINAGLLGLASLGSINMGVFAGATVNKAAGYNAGTYSAGYNDGVGGFEYGGVFVLYNSATNPFTNFNFASAAVVASNWSRTSDIAGFYDNTTLAFRIADGGHGYLLGNFELDGDFNHDGSNIGFFGITPTTQQTELTDELTTISHTTPGTPDYAIAAPVDSAGGSSFGFSSADEFNTVMSVIANLQTRNKELEDRLTAYGLLADAD